MAVTLDGAVCVVTGGASGIGAALCARFAAEGARAVVVADTDTARAAALAASIGPAAGPITLDVTDEAEVGEAVERIEADLGPIDVWCSNAGAAGDAGLGGDEAWERLWRLHVLAHVYAARTVLPRMVARGRGHLLITASAAGLLSEADAAAYSVTKHGSVALAEWLAIQHGDSGVSFSCLCPQGVRTPLLEAAAGSASTTRASGEILEPEQVADAVVEALSAGRFLILPHPQVAEYERRRATDRERWLAGMRRISAAQRRSSPPGLDLPRLESYLDSEAPGLRTGSITAELVQGGRSNLTYRVSDGASHWALRRPPLGHVLATAHDMGREYRVLTALADSPVPVPRTTLLCPDETVLGAPFYLMEWVPGEVYRSDVEAARALGPQRLRGLADDLVRVLGDLHSLDPDEYSLSDFGRPDGYLERQLRRWRTQLDASRSRELDSIDELHRRLAVAVPAPQRAAIVHGDYRLDNVIAGADDRVAAVLDWEMSTVGDPLTDVGLLHVYWTGSSRRVLSPDAAAGDGLGPVSRLHEEYAARSGLDLGPLPWYIAFGYFKLAVIVEGIHFRYVSGQTVGAGFETMGAAVPELIRGGLKALSEGD
jgi:aminoglycoside phosphotransferase (APT) family kinase protein/NAD(P)-dependent dehydrogenase (short-subunit alcohol dehydrogenase family)